jgi:Protein of unknown function (DUF1571)
MYRLLICLPLCLLLAPNSPVVPSEHRVTPGIVSKDPLPVKDPVEFLEKCLEKYDDQHIEGFTCILQKQERSDGILMPREETEVAFRSKPHSVFMHWLRGTRRAESVLYVTGENDNKMLIHPSGVAGVFAKVVSRDVDGADAKQSGRYTLDTFGFKKSMERTLKAWKGARDRGALRIEYLGIRKVKETGDRLCWALRRTYDRPEEDGVLEGTFYFDKETWLQTGVVLKGEDNKLIGEYMFRDVVLNPTFKPTQFTRDVLLPAPPASAGK